MLNLHSGEYYLVSFALSYVSTNESYVSSYSQVMYYV